MTKLSLAPPRPLRMVYSPPVWPLYFWTVLPAARLRSSATPSSLLTRKYLESLEMLMDVRRQGRVMTYCMSLVGKSQTWTWRLSSIARRYRPSGEMARSSTLTLNGHRHSSSPLMLRSTNAYDLSKLPKTKDWPSGAQAQLLTGSRNSSMRCIESPVCRNRSVRETYQERLGEGGGFA